MRPREISQINFSAKYQWMSGSNVNMTIFRIRPKFFIQHFKNSLQHELLCLTCIWKRRSSHQRSLFNKITGLFWRIYNANSYFWKHFSYLQQFILLSFTLLLLFSLFDIISASFSRRAFEDVGWWAMGILMDTFLHTSFEDLKSHCFRIHSMNFWDIMWKLF